MLLLICAQEPLESAAGIDEYSPSLPTFAFGREMPRTVWLLTGCRRYCPRHSDRLRAVPSR